MILKSSVCNVRVQICAIVAELIKSVKQGFLPYLPNVIKFLLDFEACKNFADKTYFDSVLLCLNFMFENIQDLLSPYLVDICSFIVNLSEFETEYKLSSDIITVCEGLTALQMRVLIPILTAVAREVFS